MGTKSKVPVISDTCGNAFQDFQRTYDSRGFSDYKEIMDMIEICRTVALKYSEKICEPLDKYDNIFPEYFDWADHIATEKTEDYIYHLNKTVSEIEKMVNIFEKHIPHGYFNSWKNNWYDQTRAAAWIHDIGMIEGRDIHGILSAEYLFENKFGFDFNGISQEDKIKIGMLCIKHNKAWATVYKEINNMLSENKIPYSILDEYFEDRNTPFRELDFSGRLISTADSLRHRGKDLRNNMKRHFFLWSECSGCKTMYDKPRDFCSSQNCSGKPKTKAAVPHLISQKPFDPQRFQERISVYQNSQIGRCIKIKRSISNTDAMAIVREAFQIHTRGDMSVFDVAITDFDTWRTDLETKEVDCSDLDEHTDDDYITVVTASLDNSNQDTAMFTFANYVTGRLHENIATQDDSSLPFSNKVILHIAISNGMTFSEYYKNVRSVDNHHVREALGRFARTFKQWRDLHDIVLPVQLIEDKVEVIRL